MEVGEEKGRQKERCTGEGIESKDWGGARKEHDSFCLNSFYKVKHREGGKREGRRKKKRGKKQHFAK